MTDLTAGTVGGNMNNKLLLGTIIGVVESVNTKCCQCWVKAVITHYLLPAGQAVSYYRRWPGQHGEEGGEETSCRNQENKICSQRLSCWGETETTDS